MGDPDQADPDGQAAGEASRLKSFEFAQETAKQLITLGTGIIVLSIAFLADVAEDSRPDGVGYLHLAWLLFLVSIPFGILTLMSLTGNIARSTDIYAPNIKIMAGCQIVLFFAALALTVVFGVIAT